VSGSKTIENLTLLAVVTCGIEFLASAGIAYISHSLLMVADMFNSIIEFASALVAYLVFRLLRQNRRGLFDYGLGKAENIASLLIGLFMLASTILLVLLALYRFAHPAHIGGLGAWLALGLAGLFLFVNAKLLLSNIQHHRAAPSCALSAQCRLFGIKVLMDLMVVATFAMTLAVKASWVDYMDTLASLIVVATLIHSAWNIIRNALPDLLDQSLSEPLQMIINQALIKHFDSYLSLDRVRSRTAGNAVFIDIFLGFAPDFRMSEVQPVIDDMCDTLRREIPNAEVTVISRAVSNQSG
jgi:cation diffusion facilitator family transporter